MGLTGYAMVQKHTDGHHYVRQHRPFHAPLARELTRGGASAHLQYMGVSMITSRPTERLAHLRV
jgi:hypothetical protein